MPCGSGAAHGADRVRLAASAAAVPSATPAGAESIGGGPPKHANGRGGLSFKIGGINIARMAVFAGLGAAAAAVIPPLAVLGGPIGGAVVGALLSLVL